MERNNPYITRIYDYEEYLLPHPNRESFDQDWRKKVQNSAKVHVEIGCGSGRYLMELARKNPDETFFGLELRLKRLVLAAKKIKREQLENILLMRERGEYLDDYFEEGSINVLHINFPDPWYKKKHHKRRVIQPELIRFLSSSMRKESLVFIKTDVKELFNYMDFTISNNLNFKQLQKIDLFYPESFNPKNIKTNREKYVMERGLKIFERIYIKA